MRKLERNALNIITCCWVQHAPDSVVRVSRRAPFLAAREK